MTYRKKLIEVDLPLDDINRESALDKSLTHGHPSTLHKWWAGRPLAACRAVIFASMVDDPSSAPDEFPTEYEQRVERERLHDILRKLVKWKNTDESKPGVKTLLANARYEIARSVARSLGDTAPIEPAEVLDYLREHTLPIYDPFAGRGSIPLEAQRLGLKAIASDLNPVAVLISKALIEIPPKFKNQPPVNPDADRIGIAVGKGKKKQRLLGAVRPGLLTTSVTTARGCARRRLGGLDIFYPKAKLSNGSDATVIAWLWARNIPCPNPACGVQMPLLKTFQVSKKKNNEHWIRPVVDREGKRVSFVVQNHSNGVPDNSTVDRNSATCIACHNAVPLSYVREQARAGRMGEQMTGIVAEGNRRRLFVSPTDEHIQIALSAESDWQPTQAITWTPKVSAITYGDTHWHQLFTERQLTALTTFSDLLAEVDELLTKHGVNEEYANALRTYLALAIGRTAHSGSRFARWQNSGDKIAGVFARQAIPMIWDFVESNPFCSATQNWMSQIDWVAKVVARLPTGTNSGEVYQADASTTIHAHDGPVVVTDPPYYDNINYADLSDYFYVWLRPLLRDVYPDLFAGILTPKDEEITAIPSRFDNSRQRFEDLLNKALRLMRERCSPDFPSSIFYAYKQQENELEGRASTGWETMLNAIVSAGFQIVGTWPMSTEGSARLNALAANALASSVVLVCRPRSDDAPIATRSEFFNSLEKELPTALDQLTREGHIAPTDLAQAAIGPGMQIYSRYSRVETISGEPVSVRDALVAINRAIADYDERQEGDLDSESRFCLDWLKQHGYGEGTYGDVETLARAKNVAIGKLQDVDGLLTAEGGRVKLLPFDAFSDNEQLTLGNTTAWKGCFRMAYHLSREDGSVESIERLARILYNHYDRKGDSQNAVIFNNLVTEWGNIRSAMDDREQLKIPI